VRKPNVENKYNLTAKDLSNLVIADRSKIGEPLFTRNNVVEAWQISKDTIKGFKDDVLGTFNQFSIMIHDGGTVRVLCSTYGGMANYHFNEFFNPSEIEDEHDFEIQEMLLETLNMLLDKGILTKGK